MEIRIWLSDAAIEKIYMRKLGAVTYLAGINYSAIANRIYYFSNEAVKCASEVGLEMSREVRSDR